MKKLLITVALIALAHVGFSQYIGGPYDASGYAIEPRHNGTYHFIAQGINGLNLTDNDLRWKITLPNDGYDDGNGKVIYVTFFMAGNYTVSLFVKRDAKWELVHELSYWIIGDSAPAGYPVLKGPSLTGGGDDE